MNGELRRTFGGLLAGGREVPVDGLEITNVRHDAWAKLDRGDYRPRRSPWVRQVYLHTTLGLWPQFLIPGAGPGLRDKVLAEFYRKDKQHNGCHLVADNDGTGACLADILRDAAYHATTANDWSVGIEIVQERNGGIYEAALMTGVRLALAACDALSIPRQMHRALYQKGAIVERLRHGGPDCVGIFGHRDQSWVFPEDLEEDQRRRYPQGYAGRGRGDPGELVLVEFENAGVETFDYRTREDLIAGARRQRALRDLGEPVTVDGIFGPSSMAAMRRRGFSDPRALDAIAALR